MKLSLTAPRGLGLRHAGGACALGYLDTDELVERVHGAVDSSTGYVEATVR